MPFQFVAVGTSFGGFHALKTVLDGLRNDFPLPIVVQHRSHADSDTFAPLLANHTPLPVLEVEDKEPIREGYIYVCPPNYHLLVDGDHFALSTDAPVFHAKPSIDVCLESAAAVASCRKRRLLPSWWTRSSFWKKSRLLSRRYVLGKGP
jgi:two-component system, chemotaxis family, protein-glutamate methylesterase/glutaminase